MGALLSSKAKETSRNLYGRREPGYIPVYSTQIIGDSKSKPRNTLSFQLPLLGEGDFHCGERPGGAESREICIPVPELSLTCDVYLPSNVFLLILQTWVGRLNK